MDRSQMTLDERLKLLDSRIERRNEKIRELSIYLRAVGARVHNVAETVKYPVPTVDGVSDGAATSAQFRSILAAIEQLPRPR